MENKSDYFDDIKTIKKIMEESSRFLSLSGLSGLFAGVLAFIGGFIANSAIIKLKNPIQPGELDSLKLLLVSDALIVLILALAGGFYFSYRNALNKGQLIWSPVSRRLMVNLFLPLIAGGFFVIILYTENQWNLIVPAMLIFYGLALINAGKFTFNEVFYLGLAELLTGFLASLFQGFPVFFWIFGFGFLHIAYGLIMYRKYKG